MAFGAAGIVRPIIARISDAEAQDQGPDSKGFGLFFSQPSSSAGRSVNSHSRRARCGEAMFPGLKIDSRVSRAEGHFERIR